MLSIIAWLSWSSIIFFFIFSYTFISLIIIPYFKVKSHKRPDVMTYFFPVLGLMEYFDSSLKKYGDSLAIIKEDSKTLPGQKYLITNIRTTTIMNLRDPQYVKDFLQKQKYYEKTKFLDYMKTLVGTGLVTAEGDTWKSHRKIISNSFHYEFLKGNLHMIQATTKELLDKVTPEEYKNYSVISKIQEITGEIVGRIFFGEHLNSYNYEGKPLTLALADLMTESALSGRTPLALLLGPNIMRLSPYSKFSIVIPKMKKFRKFCFDMIQERKNQKYQSQDLLSSLLATQKLEDPEQHYSDEDIINEFITFFVAGMDTTGHLISMALYNLTQHPEYLVELKKERDNTYNKEKEVTADNLQKMDLLHGLLKETLRFYTPAPSHFIRKAKTSHQILDLNIPKGQLVRSDFYYLFHDQKNFERPEQFDPKRWAKIDQKLDHFIFTPFSAGMRNCIGQHLAIMESKIIISEFIERFEFKLKEGYQLKMTIRFLYEPLDELIFELKDKTK